MSLCRALELLEYWQREAKPGGKATHSPVSEADAMDQFMGLQSVIPGGVSRLTPAMREAIEWAEAQKAKMGLN